MTLLKFRVWDTDMKVMRFDVTGFEGVAGSMDGVFVDGDFRSITRGEAVVMQFIGQTDQNGVEIYEGDILMVTVDRCRTFMTEPFIVEFLDGAFQLINVMDSSEGYFWIDVMDNSAKVIGNIYESPELVES